MEVDRNHPYAFRTWLRTHLPWFLINLGISPKGKDCSLFGGKHHWYNVDDETSACYYCQVIQPGQLWRGNHD